MLADSQGIRFVIPEVGTGHLNYQAVAVKPMAIRLRKGSKGNDARGGDDAPNVEIARSPLCHTDLLRMLFTVAQSGDVDH